MKSFNVAVHAAGIPGVRLWEVCNNEQKTNILKHAI